MEIFSELSQTFFSPMVLAFLLGVIAAVVRSSLKFPEGLYIGLTIYLLFAIGLKGGLKLSDVSFFDILVPFLLAILFCILTPIWCYALLRKFGKMDTPNAAAIAAHYGCVSAVTFSAAIGYLDTQKVEYEGYMPALLAIMEIPAIIVALFIAGRHSTDKNSSMKKILHELLTGKGTILLLGGICIGLLTGKDGYEKVAPLFDAPFTGALTLFLLDAGIVAGKKLSETFKAGFFLVAFAILVPIIHGFLGIVGAYAIGMSMGGAVVFGTLTASASYIAAPSAVRIALPSASPSYYLTMALAITFPFNVTLGIPIYYNMAKWIYGV
ncbi:MAG: sodium-dependent bicarbonate transport family permease [Leptospira sp.]|nr:sodium-dependent bicarbonate transport family permease [Leptospira sp.]